MNLQDKITKRFSELLAEGNGLLQLIAGALLYVPPQFLSQAQAWKSSVINLISMVAPNSHFSQEATKKLSIESYGIQIAEIQHVMGLLQATKREWENGLLVKIEYIVAGATFDDFLDHAVSYHKGNKKIEAAILASAVFEDAMKKVAEKNGVHSSGKTVDPVIDELVKANVFTPLQAKEFKTAAGVRNHALHAEWDKFDIRQAGELIEDTRRLIREFLDA